MRLGAELLEEAPRRRPAQPMTHTDRLGLGGWRTCSHGLRQTTARAAPVAPGVGVGSGRWCLGVGAIVGAVGAVGAVGVVGGVAAGGAGPPGPLGRRPRAVNAEPRHRGPQRPPSAQQADAQNRGGS